MRWKTILIGLAIYLAIAFAGGLLVLTSYFDESHPPPLSTPQFLFVMLVGGPAALLIYAILEALFELVGKGLRRITRAALQALRRRNQ